MATLQRPRQRSQASSTQLTLDRHCVSDAPPGAQAHPADKTIKSSTLAAEEEARAEKDGLQPKDDEFWGFKTVVAKTGLSRSSVYGYVAQGIFPRQRRLGPRRVAWLASEVRAWINSRPP